MMFPLKSLVVFSLFLFCLSECQQVSRSIRAILEETEMGSPFVEESARAIDLREVSKDSTTTTTGSSGSLSNRDPFSLTFQSTQSDSAAAAGVLNKVLYRRDAIDSSRVPIYSITKTGKIVQKRHGLEKLDYDKRPLFYSSDDGTVSVAMRSQRDNETSRFKRELDGYVSIGNKLYVISPATAADKKWLKENGGGAAVESEKNKRLSDANSKPSSLHMLHELRRELKVKMKKRNHRAKRDALNLLKALKNDAVHAESDQRVKRGDTQEYWIKLALFMQKEVVEKYVFEDTFFDDIQFMAGFSGHQTNEIFRRANTSFNGYRIQISLMSIYYDEGNQILKGANLKKTDQAEDYHKPFKSFIESTRSNTKEFYTDKDKKRNNFDAVDTAMLVVKENSFMGFSSHANLGQMCNGLPGSTSVAISNGFDMSSSMIKALSTLLGVLPDDKYSGAGCAKDEFSALNRKAFGSHFLKRFHFSGCEIKQFNNKASSWTCLKDGPDRSELIDTSYGKIYYFLYPGAKYWSDDQCVFALGTKDSFECLPSNELQTKGSYSETCKKLHCYSRKRHQCTNEGVLSGTSPLDGTHCGQKKWCINGECERDDVAAAAVFGVVTDVKVNNKDHKSISLSWSPPRDLNPYKESVGYSTMVTLYDVKYWKVQDVNSPIIDRTTKQDESSIVLVNLEPNTEYRISVKSADHGIWLDPIPVRTDICWKSNADSMSYVGMQSKTASGKTCKMWSDSLFVNVPYPANGIDLFPDSQFKSIRVLDDILNYCRSPSLVADIDKKWSERSPYKVGKPWCFTSTTTNTIEFCNMPSC